MPVPPKPFTQQCTCCGWTRPYRPVSDVLRIALYCPRCDSKGLIKRAPTLLERIWLKFND